MTSKDNKKHQAARDAQKHANDLKKAPPDGWHDDKPPRKLSDQLNLKLQPDTITQVRQELHRRGMLFTAIIDQLQLASLTGTTLDVTSIDPYTATHLQQALTADVQLMQELYKAIKASGLGHERRINSKDGNRYEALLNRILAAYGAR